MLLGTTCPRAALVEHLAGGEARGALRFWSHFGKTDGVIMYVPDYEPLDVPDAWRHEQALRAMRTLEQERVALHAAFAGQRARETDLRDQTRRDPLTSLANRVLLQGRLEELLAGQVPLAAGRLAMMRHLDRAGQLL